MDNSEKISAHYHHGTLLSAIQSGLEKLGIKPENTSVEDLGPVDEFHIGGRVATDAFLDQLEIDDSHHVLDVGCGAGAASVAFIDCLLKLKEQAL